MKTVTKKRRKGEQRSDENGNPLYLKAREPRVGSGRFVIRKDGKTSEGVEWICSDGSAFPDTFFPPNPIPFGYDAEDWPTTTDPENAQQDYDLALCRNIDWSELLIEGDQVRYQQKIIKIERDKTDEYGEPVYKNGTREQETEIYHFIYYDANSFDRYMTPVTAVSYGKRRRVVRQPRGRHCRFAVRRRRMANQIPRQKLYPVASLRTCSQGKQSNRCCGGYTSASGDSYTNLPVNY